MIGGHGDDLFRYSGIRANFSSNVYASTDNTLLVRYLQEVLPEVCGSYPEPEPYSLQKLLSEYYGISEDNILVTNGATEAIYLIAHYIEGQAVDIPEPTFSEYRSACTLFRSPISSKANIQWLCNPNNPTGSIVSESNLSKDLTIIDRSYEYYARKSLPTLQIDNEHIYIYSLTKRYKIPGLRIGYIISSRDRINQIRKLRQPWSVNVIAIKAGEWIVRNNFPETIQRESLWQETDRLSKALSMINGVQVEPTDTHFLLLSTPLKASVLKEQLACEYGILIRDASNFKGLSQYHIRISTQSTLHNQWLIDSLRDILSV